MTLTQIYQARFANADLRQRVTAAIGKVAWSYQTTGNAAQKLWAKQALIHTDVEADQALWWCSTNATIIAALPTISDSDVEYVVTLYAQAVAV